MCHFFDKAHKKIWMIMRLCVIFVVFLEFATFANSVAQDQVVSLSLKNVSYYELFSEIHKQTGLRFIYNTNQLEKMSLIDVQVHRKKVADVLSEVLAGTPFTCLFDKEVVMLVLRGNEDKKGFTIVGKVVDEKKEPMPGVTVKVGGTTLGTATNVKGIFSLLLPIQKGTLEFSFVGYKTQKLEFTKVTKDTLLIVMQEDVQALDETVVVAYGTTTKRETTGSISVVKAEEWKGIPSPSIANLLQGRVAGLDITNMSGAPGSGGTAITIRGYNSLDVEQGRRFSNPLWVVDGVPMNTFTSPITGTNLLAEINPDMIESVQVLKDASSAAIYGSRAANGVILVTTKKGRNSQKATFSANVSQSWNILPKLPQVTIGRAERDFRLKALRNDRIAYLDLETYRYKYPTTLLESYLHNKGSLDYFFSAKTSDDDGLFLQDSLNPFYNNSTNFFPVYYEKAKITNANVQTYGGSETMNYAIGLGYYDESGILKGTGFNRVDLNSTLNVKPTKRLDVDLRFTASLTNRKRGEKVDFLGYSPTIETVPGDPYELSSLYPGKGTEVWDYILEKLSGTKEKNRSVRLRSNFKLGYEVIDGLNLSSSFAADYSVHRRNYFSPSYLSDEGFSISIGETGVNLMVLSESLLSFNKTLKEDHNFNFVAGFSYQYDQMEYNGGSAENSPSDKIYYAPSGMPELIKQDYSGGEIGSGTSDYRALQHYQSDMQEKVLVSYFARLEYNYKKKYLLSASFRQDGSSVFGKNNKWGTFPAIAAGWSFTEEGFMQSFSSWFNFGKIRASWGKSGMHFDEPYLALGLMRVGTNSFQGNGAIVPQYGNGLYNEDLSWEETDQYDFGLDLDFLNYRLGVTFDYYYRYSDKKLMPVALPGDHNGYGSQWRNAAAVSNEGVEILVKYEIFRRPDLYWKVSVNAAKNWNRFEKSYDGKDVTAYNWIIGKPLNGIYVGKTDGYINSQDEMPIYYNAGGVGTYYNVISRYYYKPGDYKLVDVDRSGGWEGSPDNVYAGSALPEVTGGIVSELRWKNFDLNLSMTYQLGRHMINLTEPNAVATDDSRNLVHPLLFDVNKVTFWEKPGDKTDYPMLQFDHSVGNFMGELDRFVEKVNWLKLKTVTLGYSLPDRWMRRCGLEQVRVFVSGENLFTITNYSGLDPEIVSINSGIDKGVGYPLPRKYTLGLTVKF